MLTHCVDEQRSVQRKPRPPGGLRRHGPICFVAPPLRWKASHSSHASHLAPWRTQRGPRDFRLGLLDPLTLCPVI